MTDNTKWCVLRTFYFGIHDQAKQGDRPKELVASDLSLPEALRVVHERGPEYGAFQQPEPLR